ncbi:MAG: diiron oxygenase [Stackebrandtia sp.]
MSATDAPTLRQAIAAMSGTVERLNELSRAKYQNPYEAVEWPESVDPAADWFFTPELSSLAGTPYADGLDDERAHRLAFHEAANFFSLNIHGEKSLMEGLATRLYRPDLAELVDYLHHFLDEENKHSVYFGGFCRRYARVYRSRHVPFRDTSARETSDLLFFTKVLIFEELADRYNVLQGKDDRLHPLARFINRAHHADESRHLVFNRAIVKAFWDAYSPGWDEEKLTEIRLYIGQFFTTTWREYYNPDVYADCGFDEPWQVAEAAWDSPAQRRHRRDISAKCMRFLSSTGILLEEPVDVF